MTRPRHRARPPLALCLLILGLGVAACAPAPATMGPLSTEGHLLDGFPIGAAPAGGAVATVGVARGQAEGGAEILSADRRLAPAEIVVRGGARVPDGPPVALNLADAAVAEAAQVILGDVLGQPFIVDTGVAGTVTLRAEAPLPRPALVDAFAEALGAQGLSLSQSGGVWRIARTGVGTDDAQIFLPRHIAASEAAKALEIAIPPERVRLVRTGAGEALLVNGSAREVALARQTLAAIDVPQLAGMSMLLVGLRHAAPGDMANELAAVFGGDAAPGVGADGLPGGAGGLRAVPLDRLGALALMARDNATLDRAYGLVRQLDRPRASAQTRLFVYRVQNRSAAALAESLSSLFAAPAEPDPYGLDETPKIVVDPEKNALVISAPSGQFQQLVDLIRQLDSAPMQVLVEATILEVSLGDNLRYGVQYALSSGELFNNRRAGAVLTTGMSQIIAPTLPGFAFSIGTSLAPDVIVEALDQVSDLRVVSSPKLMVRDNQPATLQIGDQVPIVTRSAEGVSDDSRIVNTVEYRDTGVTLRVTPRINSGGFVSLSIDQEVSSVSQTTSSGIDSPTISRRSITTDVTVRSGQTVVLGGLIQDRGSVDRSGIPVLQDIPVLGAAFGTRSQSAGRTELLALLRPHILTAPEQAGDLTEGLRRQFDAIAATSGRRPDLRRLDPVSLPRLQ